MTVYEGALLGAMPYLTWILIRNISQPTKIWCSIPVLLGWLTAWMLVGATAVHTWNQVQWW